MGKINYILIYLRILILILRDIVPYLLLYIVSRDD